MIFEDHNDLVAILRFLAAILDIKRLSTVLSDSIGFLDPENIGIDIWIALLEASVANLWLFYVLFGGHFDFFGGHFEHLAVIMEMKSWPTCS